MAQSFMVAPTQKYLADVDARKSVARQYLEQREHNARKNGLIFVPQIDSDLTPAEHADYLSAQ